MFAFLEDGRFTDGPLFNPGMLRDMLRMMNFFHVAVDPDGNPVRGIHKSSSFPHSQR